MANPDKTQPIRHKKQNKALLVVISIIVGGLIIACGVYFFWLRPLLNTPLGDPLDSQKATEENSAGAVSTEQNAEKETTGSNAAVCGDEDEWLVLVVGIDYREGDYLYGLADAIRIVRVDFTKPEVNVVALPRALFIEDPGPRLDVDTPLLLNQSYFFGTSGMGHFSGSGYGAGALAETLQTNFDIEIDHYLVVDFAAFKNFIYLIGGVQINLPEPIYITESEGPFFPAGVQILDGEKALQFARARAYSSDNIRINNQTLLLQAIFQRLQDPEVLKYLPDLLDSISNMILTDVSLTDMQTAICLVDKLSSDSIKFYNPGSDLIETGREFIPSMGKEMDIFYWDQALTDWIQASLWAE